MSVWQDWLAFGLALTFTLGCVASAWVQSRSDLGAANRELALDDVWGPDDDWIEYEEPVLGAVTIPADVLAQPGSVVIHLDHGKL